MRVAAILCDVSGVPNRWAAFHKAMNKVGVDSFYICPDHAGKSYAHSVALPESWLPNQPDKHIRERCWLRGHMHFVQAINQLCPDADHVWCIEGDTWAAGHTWRRLINETADDTSDGLFVGVQRKELNTGNNAWFSHHGTPDWGTLYSLHALFRISKRAVGWLLESAERDREVQSEIHCASLIQKNGGTLQDINKRDAAGWLSKDNGRFFTSPKTIVAPPHKCEVDSWMICHPIKEDKAPFKIPGDAP